MVDGAAAGVCHVYYEYRGGCCLILADRGAGRGSMRGLSFLPSSQRRRRQAQRVFSDNEIREKNFRRVGNKKED